MKRYRAQSYGTNNCRLACGFLAVLLFFTLAGTGAVFAEELPVDIGSRLELFVDTFLIDRMDGARLVLHEPVPSGEAIRFDKPWEGPFVGYCTVIEDGGLYRLYYRGYPEVGDNTCQVTCYAESSDGRSFRKPNLGIVEKDGSLRNNIILMDEVFSHNFSPFLDTKPGVPETERYKAVAGSGKSGLVPFVSKDGVHWKKMREEPVITKGAFDSQNVVFWSEHENCYLCYFRRFVKVGSASYRTITRTTSEDFLTWSEPVEMDFGDTPREQLYTNQTHPYFRAPHIYLSLPMRFFPGRQVLTEEQAASLDVIGHYKGDCADVVFMSSRGGKRYDRTFMEGFIRPGPDPGNWASRAAMTVLNIVPTGPGELSIYKQMHYAQPNPFLERYTIRTDGFVSVRASYGGGEMVTKPMTFSGGKLTINFSTSAAGFVKVGLLDAVGNDIPGYGIGDAVETVGDDIERVVSWNGGSDVSAFAGKTIRLRFVLKDADLYSIRFR